MKENKIISLEDKYLTHNDVKSIREKLEKDLTDVISFRNCTLTDKDYKSILKGVAACKSIRHVGLNLDQVTDKYRVQVLAQGVVRNTSLAGLQ